MRLCLFLLLFSLTSFTYAQKYQGDALLSILGQEKDSSDTYKAFAREWGLGRKTAMPEKGIKVNKNSETGRIIAISFAGKGYEVGDVKFNKFEGQMPFGLSMNDDYTTLRNKLGVPKKDAETVSKFAKNGLSIIATFSNKSKTKLQVVKISLGFGVLEYNPNADENTDVATEAPAEPIKEVNQPTTKEKKVEPSSTKEKITINETMPADFSSSKPAPRNTNASLSKKSEFYKRMMEVMEAGSESYFESIQEPTEAAVSNFWNYKYTHKSTVKIPGEKYNFIYRFPFSTSQKDFVVVLKEGNYDASFKQTYDEFLSKIKADFTPAEGWKYTNPLDENVNFPLKDFEAQNAKYGSIVLDYHQNPQGQSVLYLRFLLYYD
ncbi:MAG: hypothetical protein U0T32_10635 [Chitinophagales bacterium]